MIMSKGKRPGKNKTGVAWTVTESGALMTDSIELIKQSVARLKDNRELINITHGSYLSPKVVLVSYDDEKLQIDKPPDWPGSKGTISILFKGSDQLFHQLTVRVTSVTEDSLYTTFPNKLVQLQRRADFRVETPRGSQAAFEHNDTQHSGFAIIDISASGALIASESKGVLSPGDEITKIAFSFAGEAMLPPKHITIPEAKVKRVFRDEQYQHCYGIQFSLGRQDEDNLLQYVRQLELVQVRKGLQ